MLNSIKQVLIELVGDLYYIDLPVYSLYYITSVRISYCLTSDCLYYNDLPINAALDYIYLPVTPPLLQLFPS